MDKKFLVGDYMREAVVTLPLTATMREVVQAMISHKTNGLVVVDNERKVAGIISSLDVIRHVVPDYLEQDNNLGGFEAGDVFPRQVMAVAGDTVDAFMTTKVETVKSSDTMMEAAARASDHKIRQLPVVDEAGVLVGYLNRTDIKLAIGEILGISES